MPISWIEIRKRAVAFSREWKSKAARSAMKGSKNPSTTMIYTLVMNSGGRGVRSPFDQM